MSYELFDGPELGDHAMDSVRPEKGIPGFRDSGHAFDCLMFQRYNYYCLFCPVWTDSRYDEVERLALLQWPWLNEALKVGSDIPETYPGYIRQGAMPWKHERKERDAMLKKARKAWELAELF
jgi:hypothetical protein